MKYAIKYTSRFKKDYKQAQKRGLNVQALTDVIAQLAEGEELAPRFHDHALHGDYEGFRDCHVQPDWILIYMKEDASLVLTCARTGSHSDLF